MFSLNEKTYFFTNEEMISIENTEEFIVPMLTSMIESFTTGKPCMFKIGAKDKVFYFLWGYDETFLITLERAGVKAQTFGKSLYEFTEEMILQMNVILERHVNDTKLHNKIESLYNELVLTMSHTVELFSCYDIRRKTIDELIYSYENKKNYSIIYDQLDDLSESYRIVTDNLTYLLTLTNVDMSIQIIDVGMEKFTELLYNKLKDSPNEFIKTPAKKLKKYINKK